jgi:phospholipid-binding lipoprotein MlaA
MLKTPLPRILFCSSLTLLMVACATPENNYDPLEPVNRKIFAFNQAVDNATLKPLAKGYKKVVPEPARDMIGNFFSNVSDIFVAGNNLLQGNIKSGVSDLTRIVFNSTIGIGGLFDPASGMGLAKHDNDFGQTLGKWGVGSGAYIMLPFFGPSTLRNSTDLAITTLYSPLNNLQPNATRYSVSAVKLIDKRADLLNVEGALEDALDPYDFLRDSYLQASYSKDYDGNPPKPLAFGKESNASNSEEIDPYAIPTAAPIDMDLNSNITPPAANTTSSSTPSTETPTLEIDPLQ